uniref:Uncharacterized protein n=1 Tax=Rhizophora mucronata TaxID=61149 RepID=A0A2P2MYX6_RHIMU
MEILDRHQPGGLPKITEQVWLGSFVERVQISFVVPLW